MLPDKQHALCHVSSIAQNEETDLPATLCMPANIKSNRVATVMPKQWLIGRL